MGRANQATQNKRKREQDRRERQVQKRADRTFRKEQKKIAKENRDPNEDPDLVGITFGFQPPKDF